MTEQKVYWLSRVNATDDFKDSVTDEIIDGKTCLKLTPSVHSGGVFLCLYFTATWQICQKNKRRTKREQIGTSQKMHVSSHFA
jgi:hypothetical protein